MRATVCVLVACVCACACVAVQCAPWIAKAAVGVEEARSDKLYSPYVDLKAREISARGLAYVEGLQRALETLLSTSNCTLRETAAESDASCAAAIRRSERVRGVASLALHTASVLGERATRPDYHYQYGTQPVYEQFGQVIAHNDLQYDQYGAKEEYELVIRLAKLLHALARRVGFDSDAQNILKETPKDPSATSFYAPGPRPTPPSQPLATPSPAQLAAMLGCFDSNDTATPAYIRCPAAFAGNLTANVTANVTATPAEPVPPTTTALASGTPAPNTDAALVAAGSESVEKPLSDVTMIIPSRKRRDVGTFPIGSELDDKGTKKPSLETRRVVREAQPSREEPVALSPMKRFGHRQDNRRPEDPMQDISAYSKYAEGRRVRSEPGGALQTRAALERSFAVPPLEVARRYGTNYVPGQDFFLAASLLMLADQ